MEKDVEELAQALKYFPADSVKKLQTKLTKTANSIINDGLDNKLKPFYTSDECETLLKAAAILKSVKSKVEHVKEIKARQEKQESQHRERCKKAQAEMILAAFPRPENNQQYRDTLLWVLAGAEFRRDIFGRSSYYYPEINDVRSEIKRWSEKETAYRHTFTLEGSCREWWCKWVDQLKEELFHYEEMPDIKRIESLKARFTVSWRLKIEVVYADIMQAFDNEVLVIDDNKIVRIRPIKRR